MNTLKTYISEYLEYGEYRKRLDSKTLKAYRIDLKQYEHFCTGQSDCFSKNTVDQFVTGLHKRYEPKTVKRKIASLKAFFHYMEYKELLAENPFAKLDVRFREPRLLPKTIVFDTLINENTFLIIYCKMKPVIFISKKHTIIFPSPCSYLINIFFLICTGIIIIFQIFCACWHFSFF